jgi:hypothetical protein
MVLVVATGVVAIDIDKMVVGLVEVEESCRRVMGKSAAVSQVPVPPHT